MKSVHLPIAKWAMNKHNINLLRLDFFWKHYLKYKDRKFLLEDKIKKILEKLLNSIHINLNLKFKKLTKIALMPLVIGNIINIPKDILTNFDLADL